VLEPRARGLASEIAVRSLARRPRGSGADRVIVKVGAIGIVEGGRVRLESDVHLPERARVYVLVPDFDVVEGQRVTSPRLAHPQQLAEFEMEVVDGLND
jgi:hypothetical protein